MMLLSILILLISFFIQNVFSNYIGYIYNNLSIFSTVYILIAILILNPFFENKKKYFILLIITGLIIDVAYTNTFPMNIILFFICYFISKSFHAFFPYNWITISVSNLLCISIYHIISFLILSIQQYYNYNLSILTKILSHSILMTIIYSSIIYKIIIWLYKKFQLKEVK